MLHFVKFILYFVFFWAAVLLFNNCRRSLSRESVVEQNAASLRSNNFLDSFIQKEFTQPYGIEVVYRWNRNYANDKYAAPPILTKAKDVLATIKELWIGTYTLENVGGPDFMKGKNPIRILLYGGPNIREVGEGTEDIVELVDGATPSPIEMAIYNVNKFNISSEDDVFGLMQSVHHQFVNRLLDLSPYDKAAFLKISGGRYSPDLQGIAAYYIRTRSNNTTQPLTRKEVFGLNSVANEDGNFTVQARLSPESDIAETIAIMLTSSSTEIANAIRAASTNPNPIPKNLITKYISEEEEEEEEEEDFDDGSDDNYNRAREEDYRSERTARHAYKKLTQKQKFVTDYLDKAFGISLAQMQLISTERTKQWLNKHKTAN